MNVASAKRQAKHLRRKVLSFQLRSQGFTASMARLWVDRKDLDLRLNKATVSDRNHAHRHGFLAHSARWLGHGENQHSDLISEKEYWFAQPLNGGYGDWVRDRISALSVFEPHRELFEPTHFQFVERDGAVQVIPLTAEAHSYEASIEGLGRFIRDHPSCLFTPSSWSTLDQASVRMESEDFVVGEKRLTPEQFEKRLRAHTSREFFALIEPAGHDVDLARFSANGDAHLRVVMMNETGAAPHVAEAFVEFADDITAANTAHPHQPRLTPDLGIVNDAEFNAVRERLERMGRDPLDAPTQTAHVQFFSRINPATGDYSGARAVIDGEVTEFAHHPSTGVPIAGQVRDWQLLVESLTDICRHAPLLTFVEFKIVVTEQGPKVIKLSAAPSYSTVFPFEPHTARFLRAEIEQKRARTKGVRVRARRWLHNARLTLRKTFALLFYPVGLVPYQSVRWLGDMRRDLMQRNGVPLRTKFWAYRQGFLSYRLPQYGITPANRQQFISDLEYRWLRHINKHYKYWLEDKISIKYVAAGHNECLPEYYFTTRTQGGSNHLIPLMDRPDGYGTEPSEVLRLAREKGKLALKPDEGSHGDGFYRLSYAEGQYRLNDRVAAEDEVIELLRDTRSRYLVTEFIEMHPALAEIYPTSVNTIRMIVFKRDGVTPTIGNAYFRIGSARSGFVDNTAVGGMLAEIDLVSGRFGNAQILHRGRVEPCPRHPDTGVLIEGTLPNWEYAKEKVLAIAAELPQLEYLGFDIAITRDGIKLPEINRFPDYPRIDRLNPHTTEYLLYKLAQKKKQFGYDTRRPRKLINLPVRDA